MIEHFVVAFNLNDPKCNTPKEVPNCNIFAIIFGIPFPKQCLFSIEAIVIASSNPAKFMHNKCDPSTTSSLDAIP